jgi:protein-L-isoaspartate(D-aspartate) O-methyltransferase
MPVSAARDAEAMMAFVLGLRSRGISDQKVLNAIETLPRPVFVLPSFVDHAYEEIALPIQCGQSITPPGIVAIIAEQLGVKADHRVLEIGTGSGYLTAVLGRLARRVLTLDRWRLLITEAEERLRAVKITNVTMMVADGREGWPERGPYDRIVATAAFETMPDALIAQLAPQGRMIVPVGPRGRQQTLMLVERRDGGVHEAELMPIRTGMVEKGVAARL